MFCLSTSSKVTSANHNCTVDVHDSQKPASAPACPERSSGCGDRRSRQGLQSTRDVVLRTLPLRPLPGISIIGVSRINSSDCTSESKALIESINLLIKTDNRMVSRREELESQPSVGPPPTISTKFLPDRVTDTAPENVSLSSPM